MTKFLDAGFAATVSACSARPDTDGYIAALRGQPFHVHPAETPKEWALLRAARSAGALTIIPWRAPERDPAADMAALRARRDRLLAASDWTQLPDAPLSAGQRAAWVTYRADLRALPAAFAARPGHAQFPEPPQ